jgi:hypothetical protein
VCTVICGDNYFSEHIEGALEILLELIRDYSTGLARPSMGGGMEWRAGVCEAVVECMGITCAHKYIGRRHRISRRGIRAINAGGFVADEDPSNALVTHRCGT